MQTNKIYLASQSPRRRELLASLGLEFEVMAADVDEAHIANESANDYVLRLAKAKCAKVAERVAAGSVVIGADTAVVVDNHILGKPVDAKDSARMLSFLSGRDHQVMTALAVRHADVEVGDVVTSTVHFRHLEASEMARYWSTGEPCDKAGGYAIQGLGASFVRHLEGSYSGVVGLPLYELSAHLHRFGVKLF
jgi:septum formation protein